MRPIPHPTVEDWFRAVYYCTAALWAAVFIAFPPVVFIDGTATFFRAFWMGVTILGAVAAIVGVLSGIDIKMELPGLLAMAIGPAIYCLSQFFLVGSGDRSRVALAFFALFAFTGTLPRAAALHFAARRAKKAVHR